MATPSSDQLPSKLLLLPTELRLNIWELLLAPENGTLTTISRPCSAQLGSVSPFHSTAIAHDWNDKSCICQVRKFYLLGNTKHLSPSILLINRQVYSEALPILYRDRTFTVDANRIYQSMHDRISDSWFLIDRFLHSIGDDARSHVRTIKIPMLLSRFEVYGNHQAFYSISSRLPALRTLVLEVCPSSVRENDERDDLVASHLGHAERIQYWLGPIMAFGNAKINIVAVDKHELGHFDMLKTEIEVSVWNQLLPMRVKREKRKISRILRALGKLEYAECGDIEDIFTLVW